MKNKRYHEFSVGRKGQGRVDLATGELEFVHQNTNSDANILPISINHVYLSKNAQENSPYGKGFKLNLNQTLSCRDDDDTKWKYRDGYDTEHKFKERYYYIDENNNKQFISGLKTENIRAVQGGRLFILSKPIGNNDPNLEIDDEIFAEIKTKSGLQLHTRLKNYHGSDKIETRNEELANLEEELNSLKRSREELGFSVSEDELADELMTIASNIEGDNTREETRWNSLDRNESIYNVRVEGLTIKIPEPASKKANAIKLIFDDGTIVTVAQVRNVCNGDADATWMHNSKTGEEYKDFHYTGKAYGETTITYEKDESTQAETLRIKNKYLNYPFHLDGITKVSITNMPKTPGISKCVYNGAWTGKVDLTEYFGNINTLDCKMSIKHIKLFGFSQEVENEILGYTPVSLPERQRQYLLLKKLYSGILEKCDRTDLLRIVEEGTSGTYNATIGSSGFSYKNDADALELDTLSVKAAASNAVKYIGNTIEQNESALAHTSLNTRFNERLERIKQKMDKMSEDFFEERGTKDLVQLDIKIEQKQALYDDMENRIPVNFVVDQNGLVLGFNESGKLVACFDNNDNQFAIVYKDEKIVRVVATDEREVRLNYSKDGKLESIVDFENRKISYKYNGELLDKIVYPDSEETVFSYDNDGLISKITPPSKVAKEILWNVSGQVEQISTISQDSEKLAASEVSFDYANSKTTVTSKTGTLELTFDGDEVVLERALIDSEEKTRITTTFGDKTKETINQDGNKVLIEYEDEHRTRPSRQLTTTIVYDGDDQPVEQETETKYAYDDNYKLIKQVSTRDDRIIDSQVITYNKKGEQIRSVDKDGIVNESIFDDKGKLQRKQTYHISNPSAKFVEEPQEDESPQHFGYDTYTGELTSISTSHDGEANTTTLEYKAEQLKKLESGNTKVLYDYDKFGRRNKIELNDQNYVDYTFTDDTTKTIYANNEGFETKQSNSNNIEEVWYHKGNGKVKFVENSYDEKDRLIKVENLLSNKIKEFVYDRNGNMIEQDGRVKINNTFNIDGNVTESVISIADKQPKGYQYTYDDNKLTSIKLPTNKTETITLDKLGRTSSLETVVGSKQIAYHTVKDKTSSLPVSETNKLKDGTFSKIRYTYDDKGNITQIHEAGKLVARYAYDELNRLVREDNAKRNETCAYEYDTNGNILYKHEYDFSLDAELLEATNIISNKYIGDKLLVRNGEIVEKFKYDVLGNPTTYRGTKFDWSFVRNLVSIDNGRITFDYDENGIRTHKHSGNETVEYFYNDGKLLAEKHTKQISDLYCGDELCGEELPCSEHEPAYCGTVETKFITYLYGVDGITGFLLEQNGETRRYYYAKNIQGDIVAVYDNNNALVASYMYDAWGKHVVSNYTQDNIGDINPIRYRGYYYDICTNLYYLKSRYYDAELCRFINADAIEVLDQTKDIINGLNLYAYCLNNPVNSDDEDGEMPRWLKWLLGIFVIVALGVAAAFTGGAAGVIFGAAFYGAVTGAAGGAVVGGLVGGIVSAISGGSFWSGFLNGAASGFMSGAIGGALISGTLAGGNILFGGVKIIGSAQVNSATFFHRMASNLQAGKMAMQIGRYSTIGLNTQLKSVGLNGGALRPDVIGIARLGSSKIVEVTSASQTAAQMIAKSQRIVALNPGLRYTVINWAGWLGRLFF